MASETYGVKAPIIKDLSEVRGAGGGSGGIEYEVGEVEDIVVNMSTTTDVNHKSCYIVKSGIVDENDYGVAHNYSYHAYLRNSSDGSCILNPVVKISEEESNPVHVGADSLLYIPPSDNAVYMRVPIAWVDGISGRTDNWELHVRAIRVSTNSGGVYDNIGLSEDITVNTSSTTTVNSISCYTIKTGLEDNNSVGEANKYTCSVYLKSPSDGSCLLNPVVRAAGGEYNPVYVDAASQIFTDSTNKALYMKVPESFGNVLGLVSNNLELHVIITKVTGM